MSKTKLSGSPLSVGLVQINNSFSGQSYLPYSVGILQAYAQKYASNPSRYQFLDALYERESIPNAVKKLEGSEIVFFSAYVWNMRYSLELARRLKEANPNVVTVFGGPQVPDRAEALLRDHPQVDYAVHGEGEATFLALLETDFERLLEKELQGMESVSFFDKARTTYHWHPKRERIKDIETIPSPYLTGVFDGLMQKNPNQKWIMMWETNRGCPFSCAYCDWGSATQSRVFRFELDRIYKEIDWMAEKKIEFVFCADANFGMLPRDLDIVQYVAKTKAERGFPHALSVQNTKNATDRAYQVQKTLADAGLNKGVTIAIQSTDPTTLKNVKRSNISTESYQELQRRFSRDRIETYSDMILGMPGETYESFVMGVSQIVDNGQHNRIQFGNLSILPNAAMADPEYLKKHGMKIVETPVVNIHGSISESEEENDEQIQELQELVVATESCPPDEWIRMRAFSWLCSFLYFNKTLQIPILNLMNQFKIPFRDVITQFSDGDFSAYPVFREIQQFFYDKARDIQNGGAEFCASKEWLGIWWPADEYILIRLVADGKLDGFYSEAEAILTAFLKSRNIEAPQGFVRDSILVNKGLLKVPFQSDDVELNLDYPVMELYEAAKLGEKAEIEKKKMVYLVDRKSKTWQNWNDYCREVIWWGNKKGAYLYTSKALEKQLSGHF